MTIEQTVEIPSNHRLVLDLPFELPVGKAKVAVTVTTEKTQPVDGGKSAFGCLRHFGCPAKIAGEKGVWARVVLENYAKN
jgi:hypothetical protein